MRFIDYAFSDTVRSDYGGTEVDLSFLYYACFDGDGATITHFEQDESDEDDAMIWKVIIEHPDFEIVVEKFVDSNHTPTRTFFGGDVDAASAWLTRNFHDEWEEALDSLRGAVEHENEDNELWEDA